MPRITDICPQTKDNRFNIYLDSKFGFALSADTLLKAGLKVNQIISEDEIVKLIEDSESLRIYDGAQKFLSFRPRSEKEIIDWFKRKKVGQETKEFVLGKLKRRGLVNDEEFARWWIEQRTNFNPKSKMAIKYELRQKGIKDEIISAVLSCSGQFLEKEMAFLAAKKKSKVYQHLPPIEFRQKLTALLMRMGFPWETIQLVVDEMTKNRVR